MPVALAPLWHGMIYAVALFLISFITSVLNGQYLYRCFLVGFRIRSVLISAIYRKALTISNAAKRDTTVGEIVNLMAGRFNNSSYLISQPNFDFHSIFSWCSAILWIDSIYSYHLVWTTRDCTGFVFLMGYSWSGWYNF